MKIEKDERKLVFFQNRDVVLLLNCCYQKLKEIKRAVIRVGNK